MSNRIRSMPLWLVALVVLLLFGATMVVVEYVAADTPLPEGVTVFEVDGHICVDAGEWGQCWCAGECGDSPLPPPPLPTDTPEPGKPTDTPRPDEPTNTPKPGKPTPTEEPKDPTATPTDEPKKPTPTDPPVVPTKTPKPSRTPKPTKTPKPKPTWTPPPPPPTDTPEPWPGGCVCHKKKGAHGAVCWLTKCFKPNQRSAYEAHLAHGDSVGACTADKETCK